ncbi:MULTISPECIES: glycosyltransferase family 39 protein [unclassified Halanaerobium]|uniref:ArnT family glycosyltransferase n=1 Tax=unclassified Halanaerobium TaxID=2641197 RepID=UPI000DF33BAE|nr:MULTISPECIES: glycosyltransferase family 39 protein [unclassified Halanaerobium]RCW46326.1 dolichyl-phosphate-mannose-protein mannosyltransferase [Halanaerobium sp. MA284_MarDTE_T2]RCW84932.1 dolichyl-phosphate-mannose-protein mannosyltransferase [Halanaerobium sp. DL-01]
MNYLKKIKPIYFIIIIFFAVNLLFLDKFPFVHSDEAWLSGLSRHMLNQKSFAVTEPFFDLYPRSPHAVKIIFHFLQIIFIKLFGYNIFSFRLISLIFGTFSIYFFYRLTEIFIDNKILRYLTVLLLTFDIHFIYSSHFARQEIILVFIFLAAFYYFLLNNKSIYQNDENYKKTKVYHKDFILACILGISMGIHPNIFIISLPFILLYTYALFFSSAVNIKNYAVFALTLASFAVIYILISLGFDADFFINYARYGKSLGVLNTFSSKFDSLDYFYKKIFYRVSGTYYIPPIKIQLTLFFFSFAAGLIKWIKDRNKLIFILLISIISINLGYAIIGRYNQTSIIFIFPLFYLLAAKLLADFKIKYACSAVLVLLLILSINTFTAVINSSFSDYNDYLKNISSAVKAEDNVLANLNCDYYFEDGSLFDYRNLSYLEKSNLSFAEYIDKNNIEYIIYPEEMDFIYNTRPEWNILYGNPYPYYNEMKEYLHNNTQLIYQFNDKTYAVRIVRYIGEKNWSVKIYKVITK